MNVDQPIAGLVEDLKQRAMPDERRLLANRVIQVGSRLSCIKQWSCDEPFAGSFPRTTNERKER